MKTISDTSFGGERPLFQSHDLKIENVVINLGESALKECSDITAINCEFKGKYPFWHAGQDLILKIATFLKPLVPLCGIQKIS